MLIYISLFAFLISLLLAWFNRQSNRNALYLSGSFICLSIYGISHYFLLDSTSPVGIAFFYAHFNALHMLPGPMVYFYVRGTLKDDSRLSIRDTFHFIPTVFFLVNTIPWYFTSWESKISTANNIIANRNLLLEFNPSWLTTPAVAFTLRPVSLLIYLMASGLLLFQRNHLAEKKVPAKQEQMVRKWMVSLLTFMTLMTLVYFLSSGVAIFNSVEVAKTTAIALLWIAAAAFLGFTITLLLFPAILYGLPVAVPQPNAKLATNTPSTASIPNNEKLPDEASESFRFLARRIREHMEIEKPFCKENFNLEDLSAYLQVPENHLRYCIGEVMGTKFTRLRMEYRVEYSKNLMDTGTHQIYTIESIARMSGFSSRSAFYAAFKEITGMTPLDYIGSKSNQAQNTTATTG